MAAARPCFLDATVLSNFARTSSTGWLVELLERPAVVPAVRDEHEAGRAFGHEFLEEALDVIGTEVELVEVSETRGSPTFRDRLDLGESEWVRAAIENDGTLATDDFTARRVAQRHGVAVTGSVGSLVLGIERGRITTGTAVRWLDTWQSERRYYSPIERIPEALEE